VFGWLGEAESVRISNFKTDDRLASLASSVVTIIARQHFARAIVNPCCGAGLPRPSSELK
jgi:hypothetical protein